MGETEYSGDFVRDQELLARYRAGEDSAYGRLYEHYKGLAFACALRYTSSLDRAEDIVSESFTRIMEAVRAGNGPTISMGHYLLTTVRTVSLRQGERSTREELLSPDDLARLFEDRVFRDGEHVTADRENTPEWLARAFGSLNERQQSIVWLHTVERMRFKAIASRLGVSAPTVTRGYRSSMVEFRTRFVQEALVGASDPACIEAAPELFALARDPKRSVTGHGLSCARCSLIVRRLQAKDRALLSLLLIAGLGALGAEALRKPTPAAASGHWYLARGLPIKLALVVPVAAALVFAGIFVARTTGTQAVDLPDVALGYGSNSTLLVLGECTIARTALTKQSEIWRLKGPSTCEMRIVFEAGGSDGVAAGSVLVDTSHEATVRSVEVNRVGRYAITLSDGGATKSAVVHVR